MVKNMDTEVFIKSAQFIVNRNVSERVDRVLASFDQKTGCLCLIYFISGPLNDDDVEDCEIACAELIAEFPEIRKAETQCLPSEKCGSEGDQTEVFSRFSQHDNGGQTQCR